MEPVDRFKWHRRRFADKLGGVKSLSPEVARHLSRAASIEQVLETVWHQMMLGHQMDAESIQALQSQRSIALMEATIAAERGAAERPARRRSRR